MTKLEKQQLSVVGVNVRSAFRMRSPQSSDSLILMSSLKTSWTQTLAFFYAYHLQVALRSPHFTPNTVNLPTCNTYKSYKLKFQNIILSVFLKHKRHWVHMRPWHLSSAFVKTLNRLAPEFWAAKTFQSGGETGVKVIPKYRHLNPQWMKTQGASGLKIVLQRCEVWMVGADTRQIHGGHKRTCQFSNYDIIYLNLF